LRPSSYNRLRLELVRDTAAIEGADSVFEFGGKMSDDNVFQLSRTDRKVCDAATAEVNRQ
jgi:hypothetical protein